MIIWTDVHSMLGKSFLKYSYKVSSPIRISGKYQAMSCMDVPDANETFLALPLFFTFLIRSSRVLPLRMGKKIRLPLLLLILLRQVDKVLS